MLDTIFVTEHEKIPVREIQVEVSRSSGPGGQHVNKTETRVTLRFALVNSPSLSDAVRKRLVERLGSRLTRRGELLVSSERFRERERNRADALDRLARILQAAARRPRERRPTRPTRASVKKRIERKRRTAQTKRLRDKPRGDD